MFNMKIKKEIFRLIDGNQFGIDVIVCIHIYDFMVRKPSFQSE